MFRFKLAFILSALGVASYAQNDVDVIRYARIGGGGSARFMSMGGAFGAVGADLTTTAYNPAGLAVFRKGEIAFGAGLRATNDDATIYKTNTNMFDLKAVFNNFGVAVAWKSSNDENGRHALAFANTQLQNFNHSVRMSGYTNSSSIAKDMLNLASYYNGAPNMTSHLGTSYEGLGYLAYLLDIDSLDRKFFSFVDTKRTVKQTRDITTKGRVNDLNFSYAYTYQDKYYFGISLGVPQVNYESTTTHTEADDRDSMRVSFLNDTTITDTYTDFLPVVYRSRLGFHSLEYTEYFKTTGSGLNLKLGGIVRLNELVRVGFYFHTPTLYRLQDSYYSELSVAFDRNPGNPDYAKDPKDGGYIAYRIITPSRLSANVAFIIRKLAVIAVDYEMVNYPGAKLSSNDADFSATNGLLKTKYKAGHNLRVGGELNLNPVMLRLGYNMQGSPFGDVFTGDFVRNTFSAGAGFRTKQNFYFDFVVYKTLSTENYYPFTTLTTLSKIKYNSTTFSATMGLKF